MSPDNALIRTAGRVAFDSADNIILIGSASSVQFNFVGDSCKVLLGKTIVKGESNYEMNANGCSGQPNNDGHLIIAENLLPFYQKIMNW